MISFKGALININALSDTHGRVEGAAAAFQTFKDNKADMFVHEERGKKNFLMVSGDWYMAGDTTGYLSNPKATSTFYQLQFFNEFVKKLKRYSKNMQTFFTIGNHDLDAGTRTLNNYLIKMNAQTVSTNLDFKNSPALTESIRKGKLVKSKIIDIEDDKVKGKTHKMLILGLSPVNMPYYNKIKSEISFLDESKKSQSAVTKKEFQNSLLELDKTINDFKEEYPKGVVVLMSHCGCGVAESLMLRNPGLNLVLDGHEHEDSEFSLSPSSKFLKLSKDFKKIENVKIVIDDNGDISEIKRRKYKPDLDKEHHNEMSTYYRKKFAKDLAQKFIIRTKCDNLAELSTDKIRNGNNYLANFVTDVILNEVQQIDPNIEIFGINSSAIRKGLSTSQSKAVNNLDLMLVLNGIKTEVSDIFINRITGEELIKIIHANLSFNKKDPEKNTLMQYSGLIIDKRLSNFNIINTPMEELRRFVVAEKTGEPIELKKKYKVANVEKWLTKSEYSEISRLKHEAVRLPGANAKELFMKYFSDLSSGKTEVFAQKQDRIIDYPFLTSSSGTP